MTYSPFFFQGVITIRHFKGLSENEVNIFFHLPPKEFSKTTDKLKLGIAMGATLYIPGLMSNFSSKLIKRSFENLTSVIMCLEDSISDNALTEAENNVVEQLHTLAEAISANATLQYDLPLLFIRIRSVDQLQRIASQLGNDLDLITGIVFPKCNSTNANDFFSCLDSLNQARSVTLYGLPIIESKEIIYKESRQEELQKLYKIFLNYERLILTIRVGATDFSSLFSLRRPYNRTVYELQLIGDCLTEILNTFRRYEDNFIISGPVFEYFDDKSKDILWEEVQLDLLNGFYGKTCIHPSQVDIVNAVYPVSKETFDDASMIVGNRYGNNGILSSPSKNKMNEVKPHYSWALKILAQAEIYGVLNENVTTHDFIGYIKNI